MRAERDRGDGEGRERCRGAGDRVVGAVDDGELGGTPRRWRALRARRSLRFALALKCARSMASVSMSDEGTEIEALRVWIDWMAERSSSRDGSGEREDMMKEVWDWERDRKFLRRSDMASSVSIRVWVMAMG